MTTVESRGPDVEQVASRVAAVAESFAQNRRERQCRRELDPADFARLTEAGFPLGGVPREAGGLWQSVAQSTRPVAEMLRTLARGDSSVALVSAMHPAVLSFWLAAPEVPDDAGAWAQQRRWVIETVRGGAWWGTITSEPGSGGDVTRSKAVARRAEGLSGDGTANAYRLEGQKHFGSGSGIASYMITTAIPEGETEPDGFYLDVRGVPWDGSAGMTLVAPWDGHGMTATQSHGMRFEGFPATRYAWHGHLADALAAAGPFVGCCFTAVVVGIVDVALETARAQLASRRDALRPYEQVEWARADMEGWLIRQAFEGMLRAVEHSPAPLPDVLRGKTAIAELAESALRRVCRVMGGGTYARYSPFGFWFEDVRALGFLRPPWGLAFDRLIDGALTVA